METSHHDDFCACPEGTLECYCGVDDARCLGAGVQLAVMGVMFLIGMGMDYVYNKYYL